MTRMEKFFSCHWLDFSYVRLVLHEGITKDIIGAAMAVLNELRPGLDEKLYENALILELQSRGHLSSSVNFRFFIAAISSAN